MFSAIHLTMNDPLMLQVGALMTFVLGDAMASGFNGVAPRTRKPRTTKIRLNDDDERVCYPLDLPPDQCEVCELNEIFTEYYGEEIWMCSPSAE